MIYPSKKLRNGGNAPYRGYPNSGQRQYPASDPLLGIGIQYQSSDDDIADVVALKELNASKMANEQKLADERAKRMPNEMAIREFVNKASGTEASKREMLKGLNENLTSFTDKQFADQDYIFGDAARKHLTSIYDTISPDKLQAMSDDKENLDNSIKSLIKNKSAEQYNFLNGRVSARDNQTGKIGFIDPKDLYEQVEVDGKKSNRYEPVKASELYTNIQSEGGDTSSINADMDNAAAVKDKIQETFFTNVGSTNYNADGRDRTDNFSQVNQAKAQAIAGITESQKDSLKADFLAQNKGRYSEGEFNNYLNALLENVAGKMRSSSVKLDRAYIEQIKAEARAAQEQKTASLNGIGPTVQTTNDEIIATDNSGAQAYNLYSTRDVPIERIGKSMIPIPDEDTKRIKDNGLVVNGKAYVIGGDSDSTNKLVSLNKSFKDATLVSNSVLPITTGRIFDETNKEQPFSNNGENGEIIIKDENYKYLDSYIPAYSKVETKNYYVKNPDTGKDEVRSINAIRLSNGKYIEVAFTSGSVYTAPHKAITGKESRSTIIKLHDKNESIRTMGSNLSMYGNNITNFMANDGKQWNKEADRLIEEIGKNYGQESVDEFINKAEKEKGKGKNAYIDFVNNYLSTYKQAVETSQNFMTLSYAKEEFSKKGSSDLVR